MPSHLVSALCPASLLPMPAAQEPAAKCHQHESNDRDGEDHPGWAAHVVVQWAVHRATRASGTSGSTSAVRQCLTRAIGELAARAAV
jgi:hypothetical protein